jgi:hypothetical protein
VHFRGRALPADHGTPRCRGAGCSTPCPTTRSSHRVPPMGWQLALFAARYRRRTVGEAASWPHRSPAGSPAVTSYSGGELRRPSSRSRSSAGPDCLLADEPYRGIAPADHDRLTQLFPRWPPTVRRGGDGSRGPDDLLAAADSRPPGAPPAPPTSWDLPLAGQRTRTTRVFVGRLSGAVASS